MASPIGYPNYVAIRAFRAFLTLAVLVTLVFVVLRLAGDPARILLAPDAPPEMVEDYAERLGLRRPLPEQYVEFLVSVVQGDLGQSYVSLRPVRQVVGDCLPATLELGLAGFVVAFAIGVPLGAVAALRQGGAVDRCAMAFAVLGHSLPSFFLGVLLILLFAVWLQSLPSAGTASPLGIVLPALTLGTANAAILARFARSALLDALRQPYIMAARSRGASELRLVLQHALPNAGITLITVTGLLVGTTIVGATVTETVFAWPGLGALFVSSVASRDLPVVQAIVLLSAAMMTATNLIVDLIYGFLDPRIRLVDAGA